ncbi:MAG: hypothetical protein WCS86_02500 [Candidatus Paceibacterota bacterium]
MSKDTGTLILEGSEKLTPAQRAEILSVVSEELRAFLEDCDSRRETASEYIGSGKFSESREKGSQSDEGLILLHRSSERVSVLSRIKKRLEQEDPTYGLCSYTDKSKNVCGKPIDPNVLKIIPEASRCPECILKSEEK